MSEASVDNGNEHPIQLSIDGAGVATLTLNRPEVHNAFDDHLIAGLTTRLRELDHTADVRVVVLAGNGKSFSAGADLNWMKRMAGFSEGENLRDAVALADLLHTLSALTKPTVARVHGAAYGGGVGLVAACDIAVASLSASFSLSEVRLGLIPAVISPYVIAAIGERQARRYFLTAERFDAHGSAAHRAGAHGGGRGQARRGGARSRRPPFQGRPQSPGGGQGPDLGRHQSSHRPQAGGRHRRPHRPHPRDGRGEGGRCCFPREAACRVG